MGADSVSTGLVNNEILHPTKISTTGGELVPSQGVHIVMTPYLVHRLHNFLGCTNLPSISSGDAIETSRLSHDSLLH